jgi:CTP:phosphocholine cytidylyltransferase-like protein/histidinol-phosphate/aromatic aminotransferase/cobyric acid decarboxylase-like protein
MVAGFSKIFLYHIQNEKLKTVKAKETFVVKKIEFNLLFNAIAKKNWSDAYIAEVSLSTIDEVVKTREQLVNESLLDEQLVITRKGEEYLEPYRVDNAIIMAAGFSSRCMPLSQILPKGLFVVRGEVLIEREIRQLQAAGIYNIVVVVGYKAEQFRYLEQKYNVKIVLNKEYSVKNNVSSIYAIRKSLGNSYICCSDNYYVENIFEKYVYESFYTCSYTKDYADEYCITENKEGYIENIKRGGSDKWFTIGANYWSTSFSKKFVELLEKEYSSQEVGKLLIDDFHIIHFAELPIVAKKMDAGIVFEFDTLPEIEEFDSKFKSYEKEVIANNLYGKYNGITRYAGVKTDNRNGRLHFNENLWGPSPNALKPFKEVVPEDLYLYDSKEQDDLILEISKKYNINYDNIFLHNSGSEIVRSVMTIMVGEKDKVLLPVPHWSYYPGVVDYRFGEKLFYKFREDGNKCYHDVDDLLDKAKKSHAKFIIVTSPAMPSGNLISPEDLERIVKENPESLVFVDQAYFGFEEDAIDVNYFINKYDNVMFSRTFSKFFALAGLRLGYGIASKRALQALWLDLPLLRLPIIARKAVIECIRDDDYYNMICSEIRDVKNYLYDRLSRIEEVHPYKSDTNFLYMKVSGVDASELRERMIKQGYLFRIYENEGGSFYRINVAPMETMVDFVGKFEDTIKKMRAE